MHLLRSVFKRSRALHFAFTFFLVLPASTNYELHDFGFGSGGGANLDSTNYSITGQTGELSAGNRLEGSTYDLGAGLTFTRQANVPGAPTFTNESTDYNKLHFIIDTGGNPSDTLFAIAISADDFVTTQYIKNDNTVTDVLTTSDYQTYTNWGGASGEDVIGLLPNTTYKIKVKAWHDAFTETELGPEASASTSNPSLTFDIDISNTDQETSAPYTISMGTLPPGVVTTATDKIWIDLATNGDGGGFVYVYSSNAGLKSTATNYTILSSSTNLSSVGEGFGLQADSDSESDGGPLVATAPFDGTSENVGAITTTSQTIFHSSSAPITGGRGSLSVKAKASAQTPAASDYSETITMIASSTF